MSKKLLSAGIVMVLVAAVLVGVGATTASAQTTNMCSVVDALVLAGVIPADKVVAAKAAAGCGAATASYTFTKNMTVGSTGADVSALQAKLGVTPATGYFGAITKAAVQAYQAANGISATGYVGPLTLAALNYVAPVVVVPPTTGGTTGGTSSGDLDGTDGTISDVNEISTYNNEEVGEGQENVKVLGMDIEASKDGDIQIKSVKLSFLETSSDSDNLDDYMDKVSILMGSTEVGSADVADFTEDNTTDGLWTKTVSLKDAVIRADKTVKFYVTVDAVNSFDSGDIDGTDWTIDVENIRFIDGSGVTETDIDTGDINAMNVPIDFVSFSVASDTELKASLASDSPDATVVMVDDTSGQTTDDTVLLKGKLKLEGTSDVFLDDMPITFVSTGNDIDIITGNVTLTIDGEDYSESVPSTATTTSVIVFNNLGLNISAGDTVNFTVSADIEDTAGTMNAGDSLKASLTADNMDNLDAENEEGDQLAVGDTSGTALGEVQTFYDSGINVVVSGTPTGVITSNDGTDNDSVTYTVNLKITAFGDPVYISDSTTTDSSYLYTGDAPTENENRLAAKDTDSQDDNSLYTYFYLSDGETRDFTYTLILTASTSATTISNFKMSDIGWGLTTATTQTYGGDLDDTAVTGSKLLN